jgi:hypothetical protein
MTSLARTARAASLLLALTVTAGAHAGEPPPQDASGKTMCIQQYESAQALRRDGKLLKAREALAVCAATTCPALLQTDCIAWLGEVARGIPSVVLQARSESGDEAEVKVFIDGKQATTHLDGKAIELDAGRHVFRFERAPYTPVEKTIVVAEGEKNRVIAVTLVDPNAPPPVLLGPRIEAESTRPVLAITFVLAGVSVASVGAFAALGFSATSDRDRLALKCAPFCSDSDVQGLKTKRLIADVSIGLAGATAVGALISILARPTVSAKPDKPNNKPRAGVGIEPARSGAMMNIAGEF